VNEVDVIAPPHPLPKLPVARAVWKCQPDFKTGLAAWIYAGGAHHTAFSYGVTVPMLQSFADMAGIELARIDKETKLNQFLQDLRSNEVYFHLAPGLARQ
jgi:L-arabinose isomerase